MAMNAKRRALAARHLRFTRALLRQHGVAIVHIDPSCQQTLFSLKSGLKIRAGELLVNGVCDLPHRWTIYCAALCQSGAEQYIKAEEVTPQGQYKSEHLTDVIEHYVKSIAAGCNPNHLIGTGWIAVPYETEINETQAARIFESFGAWEQSEVAA